jgi:translocation protein SEC63
MALGHGWLPTSIEVMHLHAYLAQALLPGKSSLLQYPVAEDDVKDVKDGDLKPLIIKLENDKSKAFDLMDADHHMGRLDITDAKFKG